MVRRVVRSLAEAGAVPPSGSMEKADWTLASATPSFSRVGTLANFVLYNSPRVV